MEFVIGLYAFIGLTLLGLLIYFIIQRVKDKKREDFEDRNN